MTWEEICADRRFQDFPGRIETNGQGQIIERGAQGFWLCDELGRMSFFGPAGPFPRSRLCPEFPDAVR